MYGTVHKKVTKKLRGFMESVRLQTDFVVLAIYKRKDSKRLERLTKCSHDCRLCVFVGFMKPHS